MIYTVELNFSDPGREAEWNAWYETYLTQLVSLPGLTTAQRFRALTPETPAWVYLAIYSVASLEVFASEAYRGIGGGGQASRRFREAIRRRRNVYAGIERFPEISEAGCVVLSDGTSPRKDLPDCLFVPLEAASGRRQAGATELDGAPLRRAIAVITQETVAQHRLLHTEGHTMYTPMSQRYVATPMEVERASG